ncbi:MAG TPA: Asp-tRNA(Asn)/Glu-tRNA(Gln) amidotransferase subunit GatC [Patescibacteria group bacterium]|nr:Asp-tRNA(Asn)/Glu-tRNA(Gln) amidotransferase subunit GatC [Patescibacteria group bacterium]
MQLSKQEVEHIATLARLELTEEDKNKYGKQLSDIFGYIEKMQEIDTANVESTSQVTGLLNVMREDEVVESDCEVDLLDSAPENENGYIKVPKILDK